MDRTKVIMECNPKFFTFDKNTYPNILKDYISKYDWAEIALEATRVIGNAWSSKKKNDIITMPKWMLYTSYATLFLLIFFFITLYIYGSSKENITYLLVLSLISIIAALVLSFSLAIYNYVRKLGPIYSLNHFIIEGFEEYIEELNKRHDGKLIFKFVSHPICLECILVEKKQIRENTENVPIQTEGYLNTNS